MSKVSCLFFIIHCWSYSVQSTPQFEPCSHLSHTSHSTWW
ncbi:unnamed protein product [Haemonchus placei]|uniref:Uncharacterized protein n=1 Tax=Haemonchus placei TaxID=6290 RepID=A0A0N4WS88_HAEPC|nr:unnamed protein product [Haemonchus placei]